MTDAFEFPLLRREAMSRLRTRSAFWLLVAVMLVASAFPLILRGFIGSAVGVSSSASGVFLAFFIVQQAVVLLVAPATTAGAIAGERQADTYELLFVTRLSPVAIVLSKLVASVAYSALILVAMVPLVAVCFLLGGIGFDAVVRCYAITVTTLILTAAVCLEASMRSSSTAHAVVRGVLRTCLATFGVMLISLLAWSPAENPALYFSPFTAIAAALDPVSHTGTIVLANGQRLSPEATFYLWSAAVTLIHLAVTFARAGKADTTPHRWIAWLHRPLVGKHRAQSRRSWLTRVILSSARDEEGWLSNAMFIKSLRSEYMGGALFRGCAFWVSFILALVIGSSAASMPNGAMWGATCTGAIGVGLIALVTPAIGAGLISREREKRTMDQLESTPMESTVVFFGKALAGGYAVLGVIVGGALGMIMAWLIADSGGARLHLGLWVSAVYLIVGVTSTWLGVSMALFWSARCKNVVRSYVASYVTFVAFHTVIPLVGCGLPLIVVNPVFVFATASVGAPAEAMAAVWSVGILFGHVLIYVTVGAVFYFAGRNFESPESRPRLPRANAARQMMERPQESGIEW